MTTNASPLQLERYFFPQVSVEANQDFDGPLDKATFVIEPKVAITVKPHQNGKHRFSVVISIEIDANEDKMHPYSVTVGAFCAVVIADNVPEKFREQLAASNGAHILYGAARELVADITSRGPWPSITLATMTFTDLVKSSGQEEERPLINEPRKRKQK